MSLETISETTCFGGRIGFYRHASKANDCDMRFSVFVPPQAANGNVPVLTFLSGLTCTEENFMVKSGAQRVAAELGLMLVSPDTSPRGDTVPDDPDDEYDFGLAAGFYLNATQEPWSKHQAPVPQPLVQRRVGSRGKIGVPLSQAASTSGLPPPAAAASVSLTSSRTALGLKGLLSTPLMLPILTSSSSSA